MKPKFEKDFAKVLIKIDQINKAQKAIREGFAFTKNDQHSQNQKKILEEWLKLKK